MHTNFRENFVQDFGIQQNVAEAVTMTIESNSGTNMTTTATRYLPPKRADFVWLHNTTQQRRHACREPIIRNKHIRG